jgi:hypothetical protein
MAAAAQAPGPDNDGRRRPDRPSRERPDPGEPPARCPTRGGRLRPPLHPDAFRRDRPDHRAVPVRSARSGTRGMSAVDLALPAPHPALARTRRLATAVLGLMAAIIAATYVVPDTTIVRLLRSMAEVWDCRRDPPGNQRLRRRHHHRLGDRRAERARRGRDQTELQCICINGAVLGVFVDGGIFGLNMLFG